jgi:N-methylhydantoinase A
MSWRVGVDIGGTFTDIAVVGDDGSTMLWKEETTAHRLAEAIERGLGAVSRELGTELEAFLGETSLFVHGSTVATNTVIERGGPRVGLVCTHGFRDALYFRDGFKWDRYDAHLPRPADFVDRHLRLGVRERIGSQGEVVTPLDESSVRDVAESFRRERIETVAVALLWSHVNAAHEHRVREILAEELPGTPVMLSSEVLPEIGEWVRTSATVLSAYVYPRTAEYLTELASWLAANGLEHELLIMHVNGGSAGAEETLRVPVSLIHSGPAAAPAAASAMSTRLGVRDVITTDMGGTSFDVTLVQGGELPRSRRMMVEHQPIGVPGVELHSIGAGGGSIAWVDPGGALRVGPQSAGARPGPAAYGQGGELPTVTDANVVLGYLSTSAFLGGRRRLDRERAEAAVREHVAQPLGMSDVVEAAAGVIRLVNEHMVNAIRVVSIERGIDPRPFLLVAGGGAGALHAGSLARKLGIERVLVPSQAGTLSAYGMTLADVRHEYSATLHSTTSDLSSGAITELLDGLAARGRADLRDAGFPEEKIRIQRWVDARYLGQIHELMTPLPDGPVDDRFVESLERAFHRLHEERYTYALPKRGIELLHWRVTASCATDARLDLRFDELESTPVDTSGAPTRPAWFDDPGGFVEVPALSPSELPAGAELRGPAVVDSPTTTVVVLPGQRLMADGAGNFLLHTAAPG